jgi:hypothetical protein
MAEHRRRDGNGSGPPKPILVSPLADAVDDGYRRLWRERAVPELCWIAEVLRGRALREGFRLAVAVASAGRRAAASEAFTLFAAAGSYGSLDEAGFAAMRGALAERDALEPVAAALGDLVAVFPAHPLAPLVAGERRTAAELEATKVRRLRERLEALADPASRGSLRVQLVVLWQGVQAGVLRGGSTARVAELALAARFPLTPESVPAAREVLALSAQLLQVEQLLPATGWPDQFWSRCSELASTGLAGPPAATFGT